MLPTHPYAIVVEFSVVHEQLIKLGWVETDRKRDQSGKMWIHMEPRVTKQ